MSDEDIITGTRPGREAVILTEEEAAAREAAALPKPTGFSHQNLPQIVFPIRFKLTGRQANLTGELAGYKFVDGVSVDYFAYPKVRHFSAAMGIPVTDMETGVEFYPTREDLLFRCANKQWNAKRPEPVAEKPAASPASVDDEPKVIKVEANQKPKVVEPLIDPALVEEAYKAIKTLRPGHKDDFTAKGVPNANRISEIVGRKIDNRVRDLAWAQVQREVANREEGQLEQVFKQPVDALNTRATLDAVLRHKGAVYLRQVAEMRNVKPIPRTGNEIIEALISSGLTLEEARAL